jgi:hypothetical protein
MTEGGSVIAVASQAGALLFLGGTAVSAITGAALLTGGGTTGGTVTGRL